MTRENRGGAGPELHHGNGQGQLPLFLAVEIITEQSERTEIHIDPLAIGGGRARRRTPDPMRRLNLFGGHRLAPENAAIASVEAEYVQFPFVEGGQENFPAPDAGRRVAWRQGDLPEHVALRPEMDGSMAFGGDGQAAWPAELRPGRFGAGSGAGGNKQQQEGSGQDSSQEKGNWRCVHQDCSRSNRGWGARSRLVRARANTSHEPGDSDRAVSRAQRFTIYDVRFTSFRWSDRDSTRFARPAICAARRS